MDVVDPHRNNKCIPEGGIGLGASCFMSCKGELCNRDVRRPSVSDFRRSGKTLSPTGPNEYDQWRPATDRSSTYQPTWKDPTTTESFVREEHTGRPTKKNDSRRRRPGNRLNPDDQRKGGRGHKDGLAGDMDNSASSTVVALTALTASVILTWVFPVLV